LSEIKSVQGKLGPENFTFF
jgi:serine/threonine protein kinase